MRYSVFILTVLVATSCSVRQLTERKARRNVNAIDAAVPDLLSIKSKEFLVDTLEDRSLKKRLKALSVDRVEVFMDRHHEFNVDSVIVLSKHNYLLKFGEVVIDIKKKRLNELTGNGGLLKIGKRIYFRKKTFAVS